MRPLRPCFAFVLSFVTVLAPTLAQQTTNAVQAAALIRQSVAVMGNTLPADSTATGSVTITTGAEISQGTVHILTRGTNQTSIQFQTSNDSWSIIYSDGQANRVENTGATALPLELAASSQCLYFPQPYLSGLINNPGFSLQFIGQESLGFKLANHIRAQNTFNSTPTYQFLSEFTVADIWLDAADALPIKISLVRRYGGGSSPKIPITVSYSNYENISGVRYPFTILESVNGTPWATTTIQSVTLNTGLTDASFSLSKESN